MQYYPLYRYPLFQKLGMGDHDCPVLEKFWDNSFSVPMWCGMEDEVLVTIAGLDQERNARPQGREISGRRRTRL